MFGVFVYLYCAATSLYSGTHFYGAWKRGSQSTHRDFMLFFFFISASFVANVIALPFNNPLLASMFQEFADILSVVALGFVVIAVTHFQQIAVRRATLLALIWVAVLTRFIFSLLDLPHPVISQGVIFPNYPAVTSLGQGVIVILFATIVGITLLMNLKNLKSRKKMVFFLGTAFLVGGFGGSLVGAYDVTTIITGFILLFISFTMMFLSVSSFSKEKLVSEEVSAKGNQ